MSYPQIQLTNYFLNAQENKKTFLDSKNRLKMMDFNISAAAFYAYQPSRKNYYDIGTEMIKRNFDYFAGGGLKDLKGDNNDKEDLYKLSKKAGYE